MRRSGELGVVGRVIIAVVATFVALLLEDGYLRHTSTQVTRDSSERLRASTGLLEHDPGLLVQHTTRGRRLVPRVEAVVRNHYLTGRDVPIRINSLGFRGPERRLVPADGVTRILVLGDSITFADFLAEDDTYVHHLERLMNLELDPRSIEVINAGVGDFGTREEIDLFIELGLRTQPGVVLLAFYLNDSRPPWGFPAELGQRGWLRRHSLLADTIYGELRLQGWIRERGTARFAWIGMEKKLDWKNSRDRFFELAAAARFDWGSAWQPDSWKHVARELGRLRKLSSEHGFRVGIVVFPVSYQVFAEFLEDSPQRRVCEIGRQLGFSCLDLLPVFRRNRNTKMLFYDQCHPTPEANRLVAIEIADFLRTSDLLSRSPTSPDAAEGNG